MAGQELLRLVESNPDGLPTLDPVKDLNFRDFDLVEQFIRITYLEEAMTNYQCRNCPQFLKHVRMPI